MGQREALVIARLRRVGDGGMAEGWMRAGSGGSGSDEFGQVLGDADQRPLGLDLGEAAQEELAEAAGVLDHRTPARLLLRRR